MNKKMINFNGNSHKMNEFNKLNNFNQKQNIMKKSILLLAVAASFAACTQNEEINDAISQQEIKFDQVLNKTTKAEIVDEAALVSEGGFAVFGYKSTSSDAVFDGVNVYSESGEGANSVWKYDVTRYWDKNATYRFYAIAPFAPESGASYSINKTTGMLTVTGVKSGLASASDDFIIDRDGVTNVSGATANSGNPVSFDFHHIMAKVAFYVNKSSDINEVITIKNLTMTGWDNGAGKFVQTGTATPNTLSHTEWTIPTGAEGSAVIISEAKELLETPDSTGCNTYIMVPQTIEYTAANGGTPATGLKFNIEYTITYADDFVETVNYEKVVDANQTWGTDSYTKYTLTIGASAIDFDVTSICGFCNEGNNPTLPVQP